MLIGTSNRLNNVHSNEFSVKLDSRELECVNNFKCLGVIDNELNGISRLNTLNHI
jgi:hypothetical protein